MLGAAGHEWAHNADTSVARVARVIAGALDALLWGFVIVVIALFEEESWGDMAGELFLLWLLGVLAAAAGIRNFEERHGQGSPIPHSRPAQRGPTKARLRVRRRERWTPWKPCLSAMH